MWSCHHKLAGNLASAWGGIIPEVTSDPHPHPGTSSPHAQRCVPETTRVTHCTEVSQGHLTSGPLCSLETRIDLSSVLPPHPPPMPSPCPLTFPNSRSLSAELPRRLPSRAEHWTLHCLVQEA